MNENTDIDQSELVNTYILSKLSKLKDETFEALGEAWFKENLRRNPLPSEDEVNYANHLAFYNQCECIEQCECTGRVCNDCCCGCAADQDCKDCYGAGFVGQKDCTKCKGTSSYYIPDTAKEKSGKSGHLDKDGKWIAGDSREGWRKLQDECEEKEKELLKEERIEAFIGYSKSFMADDVFEFFKEVITKLGAKLERHPVYEWDNNMVVYMPKYPQLQKITDDNQSRD